MPMPNSVKQDETDVLFDASPAASAARFGLRALELIRQGKACGAAAMVAFHFARLALPDPAEEAEQEFDDRLFNLGVALTRIQRDVVLAAKGRVH